MHFKGWPFFGEEREITREKVGHFGEGEKTNIGQEEKRRD